jgi:hypothetical protein
VDDGSVMNDWCVVDWSVVDDWGSDVGLGVDGWGGLRDDGLESVNVIGGVVNSSE